MTDFEDKIWDRVYELHQAFVLDEDRKLFFDILGEVFNLKIENMDDEECIYDTVQDKARARVKSLLDEFSGSVHREALFQELEDTFQIQINK